MRACLTLLWLAASGVAYAQAPDSKPAAKPSPKAGTKSAAAAAPRGTTIAMDTVSAHLGAYYRVELAHTDNGLEKTEGHTPNGTTELTLPAMKLDLEGQIKKGIDFEILLDLAETNAPVELAKVIWSPFRGVGVVVGKDHVHEGGFEQHHWVYDTLMLSPYVASLLPLPNSAPSLGVQMELLGQLSVQLVQDERDASAEAAPADAADQGKPLQPALTVEWIGAFGAVAPLVQIGTYGDGNSKFVSLGVELDLADLTVHGDYVIDVRNVRYGPDKRLDTMYNNVVVAGDWRGLRMVEPFGKLVAFAAAEPEDDDLGLTDRSFNTQTADGVVLDDNATMVEVGARFPLQSDAFVPYAALDLTQASFEKTPGTDELEDRGAMTLRLGVAGEF